jgi:DNA-binding HxlR family transcriptional regulator
LTPGAAHDNDHVPAVVRPDLPMNVERAIEALTSRVRVAVLRSLLRDGPASRTELAERLGVSRSLLQSHLRRLETFGLVAREPAGVHPDHRVRIFRADAARVRALVGALSDALRS